MKTRILETSLFLAALALSPAVFAAGGMEGGGLPDPAAQTCLKSGGFWILWDQGSWGGGEEGICRLPDDSLIPEWTLADALAKRENLAFKAFASSQWSTYPGPIETWGRQSCESKGGTVVGYVEHLRPNVRHELCSFSDNSAIEVWTLDRGLGSFPALAKLLAGER